MKTIKSILKAACLALIAASCTNDIDNSVKVSQLFEATFDEQAPETRVLIDSDLKAVTWEFTDNIAIFDAGFTSPVKATVSSIADNGQKAVFAPTSAVLNPAYALHPYQAASSIEGNVISAIVPGAALGTLTEACMAVAKADDGKFKFKSISGIFQFTVSDPNVKSVVIKATGIAGGVKATVDASGILLGVAPYGTADNEIEVPEIAPNQVCYVAVVPKMYSGVTFTYKDKDGKVLGTTTCTDTFSVSAGDILTWGDFAKLQQAYLPKGQAFNDALKTAAGGNLANIKNIAFMTGYKPSGTIINEGTEGAPIGVEYSGGSVFICTPANKFVADASCAYMFKNLTDMQSLSGLDKWDTSNTTSMSDMFYGCSSLTSIDVSSFNTSNVTDMTRMFDRCNKVKSLDLSNFNTSKLTRLFAMFYYCYDLESVNLSSFNTSKVKDFGVMFTECKKLKELDLSNFDTSNATNMDNMLQKNYGLEKVTFGTNFKFVGSSVISYMGTSNSKPYTTFYCDLDQWNSVSSIIGSTDIVNYRWGNAPADAQLPVGTDFRSAVSTAAGGLANVKTITFETYSSKTGTQINTGLGDTPVYVSSTSGNVTVSTQAAGFKTSSTSCSQMFKGFTALTAINNFTAVNTENATSMYEMFNECNALTSVDLSNINTANVTNMGYMFYKCNSLTSIDLSKFNTANVTNMGQMFFDCYKLTSLDLSKFNTAKVASMWSMFFGCKSLTSLDLSSFNTAAVTQMPFMFKLCVKLQSIKFGSNFTAAKATNMNAMFHSCKVLASLDLSKFNTANVTDMEAMFCHAEALKSLDLSSFNTSKVTKMDSVFFQAYHLATLKLGSNFVFPTAKNGFTGTGANVDAGDVIRTTLNCTYNQWVEFVRIRKESSNDVLKYRWANVPAAAPLPAGQNFNDALKTAAGGDLNNIKTVIFMPASYVTNGTLVSTGTSPVYVYYSSGNITIYTPSSEFSTTSCYHYFYGCNSLTTISGLTKLNTANSTSMSHMFAYCYALTSVDVSKFNTAKVTNFQNMFHTCKALTSLDLSNFSSAAATLARSMFYGCENVTSIKFGSSFTLANATETDYMFGADKKLKSLDLSYFNTAKVTNMSYMFGENNMLATITLGSDFKFPSASSAVTDIFKNLGTSNTDPCASFTCNYDQWMRITALVSDQTQYKWANAPQYAPFPTGAEFRKAVLALVANDTAKIQAINFHSAYYNGYRKYCKGTVINSSLKVSPVYISLEGTSIYVSSPSTYLQAPADLSQMFKDLWNVQRINDISYCLNTSATTNMSDMFYRCHALTFVSPSGGDQFVTSNVKSVTRMFCECYALTSLNLSKFDSSNVTSFWCFLYGAEKLSTLTLSTKFKTAKATSMYCMFYHCKSLVNVSLSTFDTSNVADMRYMFCGCSKLTTLDISTFNTGKVTTFSEMFSNNPVLSTLKLGTGFTIKYDADTSYMVNGLGGTGSGIRTTITAPTATNNIFKSMLGTTNYSYINL